MSQTLWLKHDCEDNTSNNNVVDASSNGNTGALLSNVTGLAVNTSVASVLDGVVGGRALECGATANSRKIILAASPVNAPIHFSFWFKLPSGLPTSPDTLPIAIMSIGDDALSIYLNAAGDVSYNNPATGVGSVANISASPTAWHNFQIWQDADLIYALVDVQGSVIVVEGYYLDSDVSYVLSNDIAGVRAVRYDAVRMYSGTPSNGEILALYQEGVPSTGGSKNRMLLGVG